MPAKRPSPRLPILDEAQMTEAQRSLLEAIRSAPRGKSITDLLGGQRKVSRKT